MSERQFLTMLKKDIQKLQKQINHPKTYNIGIYIKRFFLNERLYAIYLSWFIILNYAASKGRTVFMLDDVPMSVYELNTKNGSIYTELMKTTKNATNVFEFSTAWHQNEHNLYEREIIKLDYEDLKNVNIDEVLNMSQSEIVSAFQIRDKQVIQKSTLSESDLIYQEDMVIISSTKASSTDYYKEPMLEEVLLDCFLIIGCYILSHIFIGVSKVIIPRRILNALKDYKVELIPVREENIETLKQILAIRQDNLHLFNEQEEKERGR